MADETYPLGVGRQSSDGESDLAVLTRMSSAKQSSGDGNAVVEEVLKATSELVACDRPAIFLHDDGTDELTMRDPNGNGLRLSLTEPSIVRRIFLGDGGEIVNDVLSDRDVAPTVAEALGARQAVLTPLVVADKRIGVLAAINSRTGGFTDADLQRVTILAGRAALALENASLSATIARQERELKGLHRLSTLLTSSESVDHAISESVRLVSDLLECEKVAALLYDEEADALLEHRSEIGLDELQAALYVPLAEPSLIATVYRTDTALISNDAVEDAWVSEGLREEFGINSILVAPLSTTSTPIGVLVAINPRNGSFDDPDLRFTDLMGSRIAEVIGFVQARERERELVQRLWETDRTKTEFVSMLAHELRGPMTAISGFGKSLQDGWDTISGERRDHILEIITKEVGRLDRLVTELLDVSRMEAGTLRYELEPIDVVDLIRNVLEVHTSLHTVHTINVELPNDLPPVMGDRDRIRQVVTNVLSNAIRYSPEGTEITVGARHLVDRNQVAVWVKDQGIGIAPKDADKVFTKFVTLPKPAWVHKGTGLGLFISKGIVEAHGGRIWVESEPDRGSTFSFTFNLADPEAA